MAAQGAAGHFGPGGLQRPMQGSSRVALLTAATISVVLSQQVDGQAKAAEPGFSRAYRRTLLGLAHQGSNYCVVRLEAA